MPSSSELPSEILDILDIKQDPSSGRRVVKARVAGGQRLFEWQWDGTMRALTPAGTTVQHFDVHGGYVWWFNSVNASERGYWNRQSLDGDPGDSVPITSVPEGLVVGGFKTNGKVAVFGVADHVDTEIYVVDEDLQAYHLGSFPGGVSLVTALSPDGGTVTITRTETADRSVRFYHKELHDFDVATGAVTHTYPMAPYMYWRGSTRSDVPGDNRVVYNDRTPAGRVGLWIRDPGAQEPVRMLTGAAGAGADTGERFPADRLPVDADLLSAVWLPEPPAADGTPRQPQRLLVTAQHSFHTALYICDADNRWAQRVEIPQGLGLEVVFDPGSSYQRAAAHAIDPDRLLVRLSGYGHKPGWATVDTGTGQVAFDQEWPAPPQAVPGAPAPQYGSIWIAEEQRSLTYAVFLPEGPVPEGGWPTVFDPHGGPFHSTTDTYSARPKNFTQEGVAYVTLNYVGSTGLGLDQYPTLVTGNMMRRQVGDIKTVKDHLVEEGITSADGCALMGQSHGGTLALTAAALQPGEWQGIVAIRAAVDFQSMADDLGVETMPRDPQYESEEPQAQTPLDATPGPFKDVELKWWPGLVVGTNNYFVQIPEDLGAIPINNAKDNKVDTLLVGATYDVRSPNSYVVKYKGRMEAAGGHVEYHEVGGGHVAGEAGNRVQFNVERASVDFLVPRMKAGAAKALEESAASLAKSPAHAPAPAPEPAPELGAAAQPSTAPGQGPEEGPGPAAEGGNGPEWQVSLGLAPPEAQSFVSCETSKPALDGGGMVNTAELPAFDWGVDAPAVQPDKGIELKLSRSLS